MPHRELNRSTQPFVARKVFNNWDVIPRAWYFVLPSTDLKVGSIHSFMIGQQKLVLFRGMSGQVFTLDAFCPHMGTDLSIGKVRQDSIQCFFHHWRFNGSGECVEIPCQKHIPAGVAQNAYATAERYGAIWVFPDSKPDIPLIEIPGLEGQETISFLGKPTYTHGHHHISMINGLDAQHLATVHKINMDMQLEMDESQNWVDFVLSGDTPQKTPPERAVRWLLGPRYSYAMRYAQGSVAALILMRGVFFRKRAWRWPELYMLFAYRPEKDGRSVTYPIYVARQRRGIFGRALSRLLMGMTWMAYHFLKDEDHKIYSHIRFQMGRLLPMDDAIIKYVNYVDRLTPSKWSTAGL